MIPAPIILYPITNWATTGQYIYYSDDVVQRISGSIPVVESEIERDTSFIIEYRYRIENNSIMGSWTQYLRSGTIVGSTVDTSSEIPWYLNTEGIINLYEGCTLHLEFKTVKIRTYYNESGIVLEGSSVSPLDVIIVDESNISASASYPTGFSLKRSSTSIKLFIPKSGLFLNENSVFSGCNFYVSTSPGGGDGGYLKMNEVLTTDVDSSETITQIIEDSNYTDQTRDIQIRTIKSRQVNNEYYTFTFSKSVITRLILEGKIPNIFMSDGQTLNEELEFYFVSTITVFDEVLNEAVESSQSLELEGSFLKYSTEYRNLPQRSRQDVLFSLSREIMTNNDLVSVVPGSVIRDMADPISLEFERFYVIQDFIFSTLSIDTLVLYDDENGDGESDAVELSNRKRALANSLGVRDTVSLQQLIDEQFDKQGANFYLTRGEARRATGTVIFFTSIRPTSDIVISDGTIVSSSVDIDTGQQSINFSVQGTKIIDVNNIDYYYNSSEKRYEIEADIQAVEGGVRGNVPARAITSVNNVGPTIQVINEAPMRYGADRETNRELADRIKLARISFDSGTEGGYEFAAYGVPGVLQARVEQAQDPLMMRDYNKEMGDHIGGKVDIYIKGRRTTQIIDQVAFKYEYPTDTYGDKVGEMFSVTNASEYRIRTTNLKVTEESPIVIVNTVRNITRSANYDLTGMQIVGCGDTIILDDNFTNRNIGMATLDVIEVNYLYRSSNSIILSKQPVDEISVVSASDGSTIDRSKYSLIKLEDPLQNGGSSISKDAIKFLFNEGDDIAPFITITDEEHDMLLNIPARLNMKGVDIETVSVKNYSNTNIVYKKDIDYTVTIGSESEYTYLNLIANSMIRHGDKVKVSYQSSENFDVAFTTNNLIEETQGKIDGMKHSCADVIVKNSIENKINLSFKVIRKTGVDKNLLKSRIQTAIANHVANLKMGDTFTQAQLVNVVQSTTGVKEIVLPLTRMMKRNSSFIPLDNVGNQIFEIYQKTSGSGVSSYRTINNVLSYTTSENGGDTNLFRGIYEDNILLTMVNSASKVAGKAGCGYIQSDGKIVVSTTDGLPPQTKYYKVSYYTYVPAGVSEVSDLTTSEIEYLEVDSISLKDIEIIDQKANKRGL